MYIIGITGMSCSGKTTLASRLAEFLGGNEVCLHLSMDDYYKVLTKEQYEVLHNDSAELNFDTPEAIDLDLLKQTLLDITTSKSQTVQVPKFDLASCVRTQSLNVDLTKFKFVILEGLFIFSSKEIRDLCNLRIWVETSDYVCALRRFIKFTTSIKGYTHDYVYNQCLKYVIPGQETFIKPVKRMCDFFVNGENQDDVSVQMIVKYVKNLE
jgi:uridine kinase